MSYIEWPPRFYRLGDLLIREDGPKSDRPADPIVQWEGGEWVSCPHIRCLQDGRYAITLAEAEAFLAQQLGRPDVRGLLHRLSPADKPVAVDTTDSPLRRANGGTY